MSDRPNFTALGIVMDASMLVGALSREQRATIDTPAPHVIASFSGGDSFGLVAKLAADLEREGRRTSVEWYRDIDGLIVGIQIVGDVT